MKYPNALCKGDTIGVCAPSSGVKDELHQLLEKAALNVEALGYKVIDTISVRNCVKCVSADSDSMDFTLSDALKQGLGGLNVPVIYDADIGHVPPQMQIVNGAYGKVDYEDGRMTVVQMMR